MQKKKDFQLFLIELTSNEMLSKRKYEMICIGECLNCQTVALAQTDLVIFCFSREHSHQSITIIVLVFRCISIYCNQKYPGIVGQIACSLMHETRLNIDNDNHTMNLCTMNNYNAFQFNEYMIKYCSVCFEYRICVRLHG